MFSRRKSTTPGHDAPLMRAMDIARSGTERGVLYAHRIPAPQPAQGEVQLKVAYAGTNRADLLQIEGSYHPPEGAPTIPGLEVSGTIAAIGAGVVGWSVGERVCALLSGGGYGEYVTVPSTQLLSVPGRLTLKEAASLPEAAATAYMALANEARLKPYERVLVHGGASGTGLMLAQVARAWGGEVYATGGGTTKTEFIKRLGVTAIDYAAHDFGEQLMKLTKNEGVDVIIDILGGPQLQKHMKLLRPRGRLVCLALMEGNSTDQLKLGGLLMKQLTLRGATLRNRSVAEKEDIVSGVHKHIWPHLTTGVIKPYIDSVFPLEEAEKALLRMQERLHCGKILLEVAPETTE